jgi:hypothetical protein
MLEDRAGPTDGKAVTKATGVSERDSLAEGTGARLDCGHERLAALAYNF